VKPDAKIDALYQAPLEQFTEKRNALAKELSGTSKTQVKFLQKPPLPIWAVNQLYWTDRPTYNALVDSSEKLRAAHRSALNGRKTDVHKPEQIHRAALERAVAKTIALLEHAQGKVSDAAREMIRTALGALPADEAPGRLTRTPEPVGFSLLTGIKPRAPASSTRPPGRNVERPVVARKPSLAISNAEAKKAQEKARRDEEARTRQEALAERELEQARKAAEQAKFAVRTLTADLQRAQAAEEKLAAEVSAAERKLAGLRLTV